MGPITLVIMTRGRTDELAATLAMLQQLPEQPPIVVADNGLTHEEIVDIARRFRSVTVMPLGRNAGVAARNLAVRHVDTPYVAFNDDDSVWTPGSLQQIVNTFDAHPGTSCRCCSSPAQPPSGSGLPGPPNTPVTPYR